VIDTSADAAGQNDYITKQISTVFVSVRSANILYFYTSVKSKKKKEKSLQPYFKNQIK
jgi:hypothetical protein